jgi:hypothetical protein
MGARAPEVAGDDGDPGAGRADGVNLAAGFGVGNELFAIRPVLTCR